MKKHYLIFTIIIFLRSLLFAGQFNPNAFCKVPVADLVSFPLLNNHASLFNSYENLPCLSFSKKTGIPRLGQLLLHELVEIIEKKGEECRVKISNRYYAQIGKKAVLEGFWMLSNNLQLLDPLSENERAKIPAPISYKGNSGYGQNTIVLKEPWTSTKKSVFSSRSTSYSAGTRFLKVPFYNNDPDHYIVYIFNPFKKRFEIQAIPVDFCLEENKDQSHKEKRRLFVDIINNWAHRPYNKAFPYALGGSSLVDEVYPNNFKLEKIGPTQTLFFIRPGYDHKIQTGIDCSQLITRAAQIAGIPYYAGNTSTITHELRPLGYNDELENGDIIVWKGHTIIISSIKDNLIIEARGYEPSDYGIVHEIHLKERFKDIKTMDDLKMVYIQKKKVPILAKTGKVKEIIDSIKIYKLI